MNIKFKQTPENLLLEIAQALYKYVLTEDMCKRLEKPPEDKVARDKYMLSMLLMIGARIIRDLAYNNGENVQSILEKYSDMGISLFNLDVRDHLKEIMPVP